MIPMLRTLFEHLQWADATLLEAIRQREGAYGDEELRKLLHHILVVQRFFLSVFLGRAFDYEREKLVPESPEAFAAVFDETHREELALVNRLEEQDLARTFELPHWPGFHPAMQDLLLQVAMHSEHHRAQCATRLRVLGGTPPVTDYILFVKSRT